VYLAEWADEPMRFVAALTVAYAVKDAFDPREVPGDPTPPWQARVEAWSFVRAAAEGRSRYASLIFAAAGLDPGYILRLMEEKRKARREAGETQFEQLTLFDYTFWEEGAQNGRKRRS
jgi:hypothetical protein